MSWKNGNQVRMGLSGVGASAWHSCSRAAAMLAWVTWTPVGACVDPEVYCR